MLKSLRSPNDSWRVSLKNPWPKTIKYLKHWISRLLNTMIRQSLQWYRISNFWNKKRDWTSSKNYLKKLAILHLSMNSYCGNSISQHLKTLQKRTSIKSSLTIKLDLCFKKWVAWISFKGWKQLNMFRISFSSSKTML